MVLKVWHLAAHSLATVLLVLLLLLGQPVIAIVAFAGAAVVAVLHARAAGIQLELESVIRRLFVASERERALVEAERRLYLERLRDVQQVVAEQQRVLADLLETLDRPSLEERLHPEAVDRAADANALRLVLGRL